MDAPERNVLKPCGKVGIEGKFISLQTADGPVSNPMLTTYYVAGKIGFDGLFPYGAGQEFYLKYGVDVYAESPVVALDAEQKVVYAKSGLELKYDTVSDRYRRYSGFASG